MSVLSTGQFLQYRQPRQENLTTWPRKSAGSFISVQRTFLWNLHTSKESLVLGFLDKISQFIPQLATKLRLDRNVLDTEASGRNLGGYSIER